VNTFFYMSSKPLDYFSKMSLNIKLQCYRIVMKTITPMATAMAAIDPPTPPPIAAAWLPDDGASELMLSGVVTISSPIYVYNLKWYMSDLHDCTTCCNHMHVKYDLTLVCELFGGVEFMLNVVVNISSHIHVQGRHKISYNIMTQQTFRKHIFLCFSDFSFYIFFFIDNFLKEFSKKGPIYMYNMLYSYAYKVCFYTDLRTFSL